ncbi:DUF1707 domain-containing protein [Streptomyces gardneri]|uniref:DUF1707 SHOCT-like domain-containing protein n=1 Tax=Nocardia TaxID=1817 RepID=UPI00135B4AE0|nr:MULTISPECIES: DUF1707 domain-containing protein [Nocardia]MBF6164640.1 DUF1707 domain-containing protein [Streptomyces gardneri]MBF6203835.1 DUF1707 domain-containing protein [Streptomyces gardneri]UAK33866.1 DUF1707 domain-containing protein [Nocardia asteroides]
MATTRYSGIRARDTDRADVCGLLDTALAEGQLTADEHAARTAEAMRAKSFGDLDALIGDLQIPDELANAPVVRVDRRRPRRWMAPVSMITAALVAGAMVGAISRCGVGLPGSSENVPDLTTGAGLAHFLAEYRAEFGDLVADEVTLYPEYALVDRQTPGRASETSDYRYNGGFRASSTSERKPGTRTFDLATVDVPMIARLLAGAPQTVKSPDGVITHIIVEFDSLGTIDHGPVLNIYVKDKGGVSGYVEVDFAGEPLGVFPPSR